MFGVALLNAIDAAVGASVVEPPLGVLDSVILYVKVFVTGLETPEIVLRSVIGFPV